MKDAVFFHQSFTQARGSAMGQAPHKSNEQNTAGMLGLKMFYVTADSRQGAAAQSFKSSKFFQS